MSSFSIEFLWTVVALFGLACGGCFAIVPFSKSVKYPLFIAPLSGLLFLVLGTTTFYNFLAVSLAKAALLSYLLCALLSLLTVSLVKERSFLLIDRSLFVFAILA